MWLSGLTTRNPVSINRGEFPSFPASEELLSWSGQISWGIWEEWGEGSDELWAWAGVSPIGQEAPTTPHTIKAMRRNTVNGNGIFGDTNVFIRKFWSLNCLKSFLFTLHGLPVWVQRSLLIPTVEKSVCSHMSDLKRRVWSIADILRTLRVDPWWRSAVDFLERLSFLGYGCSGRIGLRNPWKICHRVGV